jgi:SAM-dependent methyltransferase
MRLAGQAKMGYYPTPDVVAQRIGRTLTRAGAGHIRTLDPCCGEGTALVLATQDLGEPVERYGIELNQERAAVAKAQLTRVLRADLRGTRVANGAFGLVYLNPPYDFSVRTHLDEAAERLELHFLQASLRYLQPQGILVYLIPERRLESRIASLLAYQLAAIQVFRFPGDSYEPFKQIVLFGVRKATPYRDEEVQQHLQAIGRLAAAPPELPETFPAPYRVPVAPPARTLLFQSLDVDPEDLIQEIGTHGLTGSLMDRLHPPTTAHRLRPLMPLRRGHLALVLASGHLNNELVRNPRTGERFLVKGRTEKRTIRTETHAEDDTLVIIDRDTLRIVITALDLRTGKVRTME